MSDLGWRKFRTLLEGKAEKYGRDFRVISRWKPTTKMCSCCGFPGGKLDLQVREWECINFSSNHDREENAAVNILLVAEGYTSVGGFLRNAPQTLTESKNGHGGKCKTTLKEVVANVSAAWHQQNVNPPRN